MTESSSAAFELLKVERPRSWGRGFLSTVTIRTGGDPCVVQIKPDALASWSAFAKAIFREAGTFLVDDRFEGRAGRALWLETVAAAVDAGAKVARVQLDDGDDEL